MKRRYKVPRLYNDGLKLKQHVCTRLVNGDSTTVWNPHTRVNTIQNKTESGTAWL